MTKARAPLSIDAALARIAGHLPGGYTAMAGIVGRAVRTVRNWGDPDTAEHIPLDCAISLDLAFIAAGGDCAPLFETYQLLLDLAQMERFSSNIALGKHAAQVIREGGEAHSALLLATLPGATEKDRKNALRECSEAFDVIKRVLPLLGAPPADDAGVRHQDPTPDQHHPP